MNKFFCADACRGAGEDIIGSGTNYGTYVLIEHSGIWDFDALNSQNIPDNLKQYIAEIKQSGLSLRFLLIKQHKPQSQTGHRIIIYDQTQAKFSSGYEKFEFKVEHLEQVSRVVKDYLQGKASQFEVQPSHTRDILVCTHGSHDKCCAKYGIPFYMESLKTLSELKLQNVQIWKASHFGGHRFAPTCIDFPDGRYYGLLDQTALRSILTRKGDIECFNRVYRGWGILPTDIQCLERELILLHGWQWFKYKIAAPEIKKHSDDTKITVSLVYQASNSRTYHCDAELVKDDHKTMELKGSCEAQTSWLFVKYAVKSFHLTLELESPVQFKSFSENKAS